MIDQLKKKLEAELNADRRELKVELPKEIKKATELGDLSENAEYKSALERQEYLKIRIDRLQKRLGELSMLNVDRLPSDRAAFGSRLRVYDLDNTEEKWFSLVMPEDADLKEGLISLSSPLGRGFLGRKGEDEVTVQTPGGIRRFEILELLTIHDLSE